MVKLPEGMPDAIGPATIYTIGSKSEIDNNSYYSDIESKDLSEFLDYHWKVIDEADLESTKDTQAYINHLNSGFGEPEAVMMCFDPRHAITYESKFGHVTALICFECGKVSVSIEGWNSYKYFVSWPQDEVNGIYNKYGVRVPFSR